jgi:hypothetical protein
MNDTILPLPNGDFTTVGYIEKHGPLTITCHHFRLGDVEDPDLYAAEPLWQWQNSEMGKWVMENAVQTPTWNRYIDHTTYGYQYAIRAELSPKHYTYWWFKWGHELDVKQKR